MAGDSDSEKFIRVSTVLSVRCLFSWRRRTGRAVDGFVIFRRMTIGYRAFLARN